MAFLGVGRRAFALATAAVTRPGVLGQFGAEALPSLQFRQLFEKFGLIDDCDNSCYVRTSSRINSCFSNHCAESLSS